MLPVLCQALPTMIKFAILSNTNRRYSIGLNQITLDYFVTSQMHGRQQPSRVGHSNQSYSQIRECLYFQRPRLKLRRMQGRLLSKGHGRFSMSHP
jgi:hypothetical protein